MGRQLTIRGRRDEPPGALLDPGRLLAKRRSLNFRADELQPTSANSDFFAIFGRRPQQVPERAAQTRHRHHLFDEQDKTMNQLDIYLPRNYALTLKKNPLARSLIDSAL